MEYTHRVRRRARALRRFAVAAAQPAVLRRGTVVGAYWWVGLPNFGDDLTPWLLPRYGVVPVHRTAGTARLAGVGSILEHLPQDFSGAIWGSGLMHDREHPMPAANVLAVRGRLTAERIGAPQGTALGDPGLLVGRRVRRAPVRWDVGIVPHFSHRTNPVLRALAGGAAGRVRTIEVQRSAARTVRDISACGAVVTTSLHGLITADAFGIPAVWTSVEPDLGGGDFKFRDYESVVTPGRTRFVSIDEHTSLDDLVASAEPVSRTVVRETGDALIEALGRLPDALGGLERFPLGILEVVSGRDLGGMAR
ncbi:polysaccharide pyruvyl transferase family protein [Agromyces sp. GXS1127]|uniref:polysaccharide pyruvyl transferase family protein n=1 Tax=Agromyces sp. GXS1127 TaxID=3424181 RepID=UPI003D31399F